MLTSLGTYMQIQRKDGRKLAVLRATRNAIFLRKTFTLTPPKVDMSFNLHATAGVSYKGKSPLLSTRHAALGLLPAADIELLRDHHHALVSCTAYLKSDEVTGAKGVMEGFLVQGSQSLQWTWTM